MIRRIKICHIINGFENGGAEAVIYNYASHMDSSNIEFHIIAHSVEVVKCKDKFVNLGFSVHIIPSKKHIIKHILNMYRIFRNEKFDIIHIATTEWAFIAGIVGLVAGCKNRINHSHMAEIPKGLVNRLIFKCKTTLGKIFTNYYWACGIMVS